MNQFFNPLSAPGVTCLSAVTALAIGTQLSMVRLQTALAEQNHNSIAAQRATICRILPATEKLELGAYYFQPTTFNPDGGRNGVLLNEGQYVCDRFGATARIERGGYAQHLAIATDISAINKTLQERLNDESNPDSMELTRVLRAANLGVWREPPQAQEPAKATFFDLN